MKHLGSPTSEHRQSRRVDAKNASFYLKSALAQAKRGSCTLAVADALRGAALLGAAHAHRRSMDPHGQRLGSPMPKAIRSINNALKRCIVHRG